MDNNDNKTNSSIDITSLGQPMTQPTPGANSPVQTAITTDDVDTSSIPTLTPEQHITTAPPIMPASSTDLSTTITTPTPPSTSAPVMTPMGVPTPSLDTTQSQPIIQQPTLNTTPGAGMPTQSEQTAEGPVTPKKKGVSPAVTAAAMLMFVGVLGFGVFTVSRAISSQQAIAPTAPVSEPAAYLPEETEPVSPSGIAVDDGSVNCVNLPNTAAFREECYPVAYDEMGTMYWIPQTVN